VVPRRGRYFRKTEVRLMTTHYGVFEDMFEEPPTKE
jgi:hypothetical protein